jgi:predicted MPP superfamily phosphohydrolase
MNTQQQLYLAASGALDVALAVWMLRPSSGKVTLLRCAAVSVACVLFAVVKLPLAALVTTSLFFAISLAYVGIVVVAPLAASIVLLRAGSAGVTRAAKLLLWSMALVLPLVGVYASFIEPFRLVEERVEVVLPAERAPSEPLRIAVLADIQSRKVDEHLREAVRRALAFEPHLIVLPGDLIQEHPEENYLRVIDEFRALLAPLEAPLGVYFALGNTDTPRLVGRVFEGTNVQLLENQSVEHTFGGRRVLVGGAGFRPFAPRTREFVERFDQREGDELRILVAHYPDIALELDDEPALDLIIAGHTHGGQVRLPFFGAPLTLSGVPRAVGSGGLHELDGRRIYVSRGVGCERGAAPRLRFLCPPEVSLITVRAP